MLDLDQDEGIVDLEDSVLTQITGSKRIKGSSKKYSEIGGTLLPVKDVRCKGRGIVLSARKAFDVLMAMLNDVKAEIASSYGNARLQAIGKKQGIEASLCVVRLCFGNKVSSKQLKAGKA